jgi:hypothetical protein
VVSLMYSAAATRSTSANINVAVATSDIGPVLLLLECTNSSGYPHDAALFGLAYWLQDAVLASISPSLQIFVRKALILLDGRTVSGRASIA